MDKMNFLFVGVGGQGVLTASDIAAQVGLDLGLEAKKSEVHGFAQRGGVVESHVRWAPLVGSPTCEKGTVDALVAFELLEAARWVDWLRPGGTVVVNTQRIMPMSVTVGDATYPASEAICEALERRAGRLVRVDGLTLAAEAGTTRAINTVILGALSAVLDTPAETWEEAIVRRVPAKYDAVNRTAFRMGREAVG
ncbi:MAG: indolepyruvate oxidoreductase subunit beta [Anaerolineae bacterium]|nr:indolepyruvate oxidoreductase subunit beta [Anaerolineae bacterium]